MSGCKAVDVAEDAGKQGDLGEKAPFLICGLVFVRGLVNGRGLGATGIGRGRTSRGCRGASGSGARGGRRNREIKDVESGFVRGDGKHRRVGRNGDAENVGRVYTSTEFGNLCTVGSREDANQSARFAGGCEPCSIGGEVHCPESRGVGRNDAHVSGAEFDELNLAWRPTGKGQMFGTQTAETERIVGGFKDGRLFGRRGELVKMDTVLNGNDNPGLCQSDPQDGSLELEGDGDFLFCIVPDDDLICGCVSLEG